MRKVATTAFAVFMLVGVAGIALAAEQQTLTGNVMCAKCTLKEAGFKKCQDVLVVKDQTSTKEYYLTKNDVLSKFGHTCTGEKAVVVTGVVTEKDGKMWLTPTTMEAQKM